MRFDVDDSGTSVLIAGKFLAIDRPRVLRFTWSNSNCSDPTTVSVVALMSIEHSLIPPEEFEGFHNGWIRTSDQLATVLQGTP